MGVLSATYHRGLSIPSSEPELGEETNQENREDRREEDDMWAMIMTNIKKLLVASG